MKNGSKVAVVLQAARNCARQVPDFVAPRGPGDGNKATNAFMKKLRSRIGRDRHIEPEKAIFEKSKSSVDFYIPKEGTVIEIALSLKNPLSEFYKDLLKTLIMKNHYKIKKLVFISKPGGRKKIFRDDSLARIIKDWLEKKHKIKTEVIDI